MIPSHVRQASLIGAVLLSVACSSDSPVDVGSNEISCSIPESQILSGARRDAIPALTNPLTALPGQDGTEYLREDDRVVGIFVDGEPLAVPLNIFWWHEIVNLSGPGYSIVVSHCPLTGSSLAFDRSAAAGAEFGVSGLLFQNNLIMYDRSGGTESLWPQMLRGARCGSRNGTDLAMVAIVEMTWGGWQQLHPDTKVLTSNQGFDRDYRSYPYGSYASLASRELLFPLSSPIDTRRPPKERALGITDGSGGMAYPYGELDRLGEVGVVPGSSSDGSYVVFWERSRKGAMAFRPALDGQTLTFSAAGDVIVDDQTGSGWGVDGIAVTGEHAGRSLEPVEEAFVAFWFAWPTFYPQIQPWSAS